MTRTIRALLLLAFAALMPTGLAGCGDDADADVEASATASTSSDAGDDTPRARRPKELVVELVHDGETYSFSTAGRGSANLGQGSSEGSAMLKFMAGFVDVAAASAAGRMEDEQEQRRAAMGSFGILTVELTVNDLSPGEYPLNPAISFGDESDQGVRMTFSSLERLGIDGQAVATDGTLTIDAFETGEGQLGGTTMTAFTGTFAGTFKKGVYGGGTESFDEADQGLQISGTITYKKRERE